MSEMLPCCCAGSAVVDSVVGHQGEEHKRCWKAKTLLKQLVEDQSLASIARLLHGAFSFDPV